jgi:peptide/nickel transport system permease protein
MFRVVIFTYFFTLVFGTILHPTSPNQTQTDQINHPPGKIHIAGTDNLGRDVLSRSLHGGQNTIIQAGAAAALATSMGVLSALRGGIGQANNIIDKIIETTLAIPNLILSLTIITLLGNTSESLIIAVGVAQTPSFGKFTRKVTQHINQQPYIHAAEALGAGKWHIYQHHLIPNSLPTISAYACITFAQCILNLAALTFLGFGGEPGQADWGVMLYEARQAFRTAPWIGILPGIGITTSILILNELADRISTGKGI